MIPTQPKLFSKRFSHHSIIALIGFVLMSFTWVAVAVQIDRDYRMSIEIIHRENSNLAKSFAEHVRRTLIGIDKQLKLMGEEYERESAVSAALTTMLRESTIDPAIVQLSVIDSKGQDIASMVPPSDSGNVSDRAYFQVHLKSDKNDLFIGKPTVGRMTGKLSMHMSRRMNNPDGSFKGIVSAALMVDYFVQYYRQMELGEGKLIALNGMDGIMRARLENEKVQSGLDISESELFKLVKQKASDSALVMLSSNQQPYFVSYRTLHDYPLYVVVGVQKDNALASYHNRRFLYIVLALLASISIIVAGYIILRHRKKEARILEELQYSNEKFAKAYYTSPDSVNINRLSDGLYIEVNQGFEKMSGYSRDEALGKTSADLNIWVNKEDRINLVNMLKEYGEAHNLEAECRAKSGEIRACLVSAAVIELKGELCILSVIRDISERKKMEKEMRAMERLSSLGTLAAGVAHEINQPLQALKVTADGALYWLDKGKPIETEQAKENFSRISRSADRISSIVKRLRDFVHRSQSTDMAEVNLNDVKKGAAELLEARLKSHSITLRERLSSEPVVLWGNSGRLEEIYINLVVNAMHALDTVDKPNKEIVITTECSMEKVVLEIFNNGPPIPQDIIEKIYDPFFSTKTTNGENMGLGLSIVQSIVTEHGGHIAAINHEEGVGFRMEFPRYKG